MYKFFISSLLSLTVVCSGCKSGELISETDESNSVPWTECSYETGDHPCDFDLVDQNGDTMSLYENYGKVIVIDFSTEWCGYCQVAASDIQRISSEYDKENFVYITIIIETMSGSEPTQDDLKRWADNFGIIDAPVLSGNRSLIASEANDGWSVTGWPTFYFITSDMIIHEVLRGYSASSIDYLIEDTMSQ
jgi:thiol-disulfide isomerase/thioredoxin